MSSRDRPDQFADSTRRPRTASDRPAERSSRANDATFDIDPADIDRYLSGRERSPSRQVEGPGSSERTTASELDRLRRTLGQPAPQPRSSQEVVSGQRQSRERSAGQSPPRPATSRRPPARDDAGPSNQDPRRTASEAAVANDFSTLEPQEELWEDDPVPAPRRARAAVRRPTLPQVPQIRVQKPTLPRFIVRAELINDPPSLTMIAGAILGLALMAIMVANRADVLPASFATHVSASGVLDNFASRNAIWRLPLLTAMLTLMDIGIAWIIMRLDRFAGRILIGGALLMQCIAWVAVFRLLW